MDLRQLLLPSWTLESRTTLTYEQIGHFLVENVITGPSFYSSKPYYGSLMPQGFSARRVWGRFKKTNFSPTVEGLFGVRDGAMVVRVTARPHPLWLGMFWLFASQGVLFSLLAVPEFFQTGDFSPLIGGLFPLAAVFAVAWPVFWLQCRTDLRFWQGALHLWDVKL